MGSSDRPVTLPKRMFEKSSVVTLSTCRSPLTPLKKGETGLKVPLFKGDLGGSKRFATNSITFQTSSKPNTAPFPIVTLGHITE